MVQKKIPKRSIILFKKIVKIMAPPPKLTISEWADTYRKLSKESSSEPGQWRTERTPYLKEIMDAVSDHEIEKVVLEASSQVGKTELELNIIGYYIHYDPAPMMILLPTLEMAKSFSKKRLATMVRDTPCITDKVSDVKSRDSDNTIFEKGFPGGYIVLVGANSPTNLSSRPIRILLADEVDRFPASAGDEGDPLSLAEKRTKTFWNKKKIYVSTPVDKETSKIDVEYEKGTMEEWCLTCPMCGKFQPLKWAQIRFDDVTMECKFCKERFTEYDWKNQEGQWIAQKQNADKKTRSFHINALSSPWERWDDIIKEFHNARNEGKEVFKTFVNTSLGEPWEDQDGEFADEEQLLNRRKNYECEIPDKVLVLTAGVDVQDDRLEIEVVGWGIGKESWGIYYKQIMGNPLEEQVWEDLDSYLIKKFKYKDGAGIMIACCCVDSGYQATEVYKFCRKRESRRVFAIKGKGGVGVPFIGKPTRNNRQKCALFQLGVDMGKASIISRLKTKFEDSPGYCHFPIEQEKGYDEYYFKGLTSERRIIKFSKGKKQYAWVKKKTGLRNEALDLRNYATAALEIINPNLELLQNRREKGEKTSINVNNQQRPQKRRGVVNKGIQL